MASEHPVFLITGASTGIGAETARAAVAAGYRVVLSARSEDKLRALADELGGDEHAIAVRADVTTDGQRPVVPPELGGQRGDLVLGAGGEHEAVAGVAGAAGGGGADAGRGAGDEEDGIVGQRWNLT